MTEITITRSEQLTTSGPRTGQRIDQISLVRALNGGERNSTVRTQKALETICAKPYMRSALLREIDNVTQKESDAIKQKQEIVTDVFVIGTGPHATVFAQRLKTLNPDVEVLFAEKNSTRGGQFRQMSEAYNLNSANIAPSSFGFKYEQGEPNDLGKDALLQSRHISQAKYPTNADQGIINTINSFQAAPSLIDTQVLSVEKSSSETKGRYKITLLDLKKNKRFTIHANTVLGSIGMGESPQKTESKGNNDGVFTFPDFMEAIKDENIWKIKSLISQGVAIVGGGDSGLIALEKIMEKRKKNSLLVNSIDMFGVPFKNASEFSSMTIDRYKHLEEFFASDKSGMLSPGKKVDVALYKEKVKSVVLKGREKSLLVQSDTQPTKKYGVVILATGYENAEDNVFSSFIDTRKIQVHSQQLNCSIARKVLGEEIFFIGPAARIPYTQEELGKIPKNHQPRYINSLRRLIPRSEQLAERIANQYGYISSFGLVN